MSYGPADKIISAAGIRSAANTPPIDPALYRREDMRRILAARDITVLYHVLKDEVRLTQRRIAELTGQSQSEVSEILQGRRSTVACSRTCASWTSRSRRARRATTPGRSACR